MRRSANHDGGDTHNQSRVVAANSYRFHCRTPFLFWLALVMTLPQYLITERWLIHFNTCHRLLNYAAYHK